jgi:hypothetical protein
MEQRYRRNASSHGSRLGGLARVVLGGRSALGTIDYFSELTTHATARPTSHTRRAGSVVRLIAFA